MNTWQLIETAPLDGSRILAWNENWSAPNSAQYYGIKGWGLDYEMIFKSQPTHWMPLPEPPSNYKHTKMLDNFDRQFQNLTEEKKWEKANKAIDNLNSRFSEN